MQPRKISYINKLTKDNISISIKATQYEPNQIKDNLAVLKRIDLADKIHFLPEERHNQPFSTVVNHQRIKVQIIQALYRDQRDPK